MTREELLVDIVRENGGVWSHQLGNTKITYQNALSAEEKGLLTVSPLGRHWYAC